MGVFPLNRVPYDGANLDLVGNCILAGPWRAIVCVYFVILLIVVEIYSTDAKTVTLDLNARHYPASTQINNVGWPGIPGPFFALSGRHPYVLVADMPWNLHSETARNKRVQVLDQSGWVPGIEESRRNETYMVYEDFLIVPHHSILATFAHSPYFEEFSIGLNRQAPLWKTFEHGATFCDHTQTLYLEPSRLTSCLGEHIATLSCTSEGPLTCRPADGTSVKLSINNKAVRVDAYDVTVSPFDYSIEMGSAFWPACQELLRTYYRETAKISIGPFKSGRKLERSGRDIVPSDPKIKSRLPRNFLYCNESYIPKNAMTLGLLRSGSSFYYSPATNTLELYTTRKNTMKNSWEDVYADRMFCFFKFLTSPPSPLKALFSTSASSA